MVMAVSFTNHSSLLAHPHPHPHRPSAKPQSVLKPLQFNFQNPRLSNFSPIYTSHVSTRPFTASLAANHSSPTTSSEEETHHSDVEQPLSLMKLISVYKEAIILGDKRTVLDIEAKIKHIETKSHELARRVSDLSSEISSGKDKYIRLQADFDNYRKRADKEKLSIRVDAQGEVIESLLPMVDSFERAKQQIKPETEMEKKIDASYQGIYKQFVEIMRSLQVAVVATVGKPFDPSLHEAIGREESQEYNDGIIIKEYRRGFLLGGRLLRPAMVIVSSGPGRKKATISAEQPATAAGVDDSR